MSPWRPSKGRNAFQLSEHAAFNTLSRMIRISANSPVLRSPPTMDLSLPTDFVASFNEVLCSKLLTSFKRWLSNSFLVPDGACTLITLLLSSALVPAGVAKKC